MLREAGCDHVIVSGEGSGVGWEREADGREVDDGSACESDSGIL